jgi:transcriptional/translational regulatory protein YebC/TACO1
MSMIVDLIVSKKVSRDAMLDTITYEINKALKSDAENADMERIISLAVDLAANKNVKQETITSEIHKALEKNLKIYLKYAYYTLNLTEDFDIMHRFEN